MLTTQEFQEFCNPRSLASATRSPSPPIRWEKIYLVQYPVTNVVLLGIVSWVRMHGGTVLRREPVQLLVSTKHFMHVAHRMHKKKGNPANLETILGLVPDATLSTLEYPSYSTYYTPHSEGSVPLSSSTLQGQGPNLARGDVLPKITKKMSIRTYEYLQGCM